MHAIGARGEIQMNLEKESECILDLRDADLGGQNLYGLNLSNIVLGYSSLTHALLFGTDFSHTNLVGADLSAAHLGGTNFTDTTLTDANLSSIKECYGTDFSNALLLNANLSESNLSNTIVANVDFSGANLANTKFYDRNSRIQVEGLTQNQIDLAMAIPEDKPPHLDGVIDEETGKEIVWRRKGSTVVDRDPEKSDLDSSLRSE